MKIKYVLIVFIGLFFGIANVNAQDQNIEQLKVKVNNIDTLLCDTLDGFKGPNQLLRGYQWGNNRSVSQAIFANQNSIKLEFFCIPPGDTIFVPDPEELQDNAYVLVCDPRFWSGTLYDTTLMHSHSMTLRQASMLPKKWKFVDYQPHASAWGKKCVEARGLALVDSSTPRFSVGEKKCGSTWACPREIKFILLYLN